MWECVYAYTWKKRKRQDGEKKHHSKVVEPNVGNNVEDVWNVLGGAVHVW